MLPRIEIQTKELNTEIDLLQKIHEYYPIGLPQANEKHPGFTHLKRILEEKINLIIEKRLPIEYEDLLKELEKTYTGLNIQNESHRQSLIILCQ